MTEKRRPGRPATGETPRHSMKMPDDRWDALGAKAQAAGSDRSKVLNELAAWYVREPGAKLPQRPGSDLTNVSQTHAHDTDGEALTSTNDGHGATG